MNTIDESFVEKYAKKIMGFSYNKMQNTFMAEDLAQEIMLQITQALHKNDEIENMDAYVSTLCKYTWSNYLKKNKKHWENYDISEISYLADASNVEQEVETTMLTKQLEKEVSYLSKLHRKIIKAFYFDNKTTKVISEELKLNESTVRWHLTETRKELRKAMELKEERLAYEPVRMWCGHDGKNVEDMNLYGFANDLLVQNIVWACYGEPLALDEIGRKLNVSAAYLENHIAKLVEMDYLKNKQGKYQTTFYISTPKDEALKIEFAFKHIGPYAEKILSVIESRIDDIMNIGFAKNVSVNRTDVIWMTYVKCAQELLYEYLGVLFEKEKVFYPKRSDGSEHWVVAGIFKDIHELGLSPELIKFADMSQTHGYRYADIGDFSEMGCMENYLNRERNPRFRKISKNILNNLTRVYRMIIENRKPDEYDKIIISELVKEGYVKVVDGKPEITVMYMTREEAAEYQKIVEEIKGELGVEFFKEYIDNFRELIDKQIPSFISKTARKYYAFERTATCYALGWIIYNKKLEVPTGDRALAVCTMVFEK